MTLRYRLRTLLILLAILPPLLAAGWWGWREWRERLAAEANRTVDFAFPIGGSR